ncbi:MAG: pilus assembly protein TadG-related protein [Telluria sp.]
MKRHAHACVRRHRQRGVFAVAGILMLVPIITLFGLALDLTVAYARRAEMQDVADAAALAAARALNGTVQGVQAAQDAAAATAALYDYGWGAAVPWNAAALAFSDDPDAEEPAWLVQAQVNGNNARGLSYARVDTRQLVSGDGVALGDVTAMFMQRLGNAATVSTAARAVAGPTATRALPLAVCAMRQEAAWARPVPPTTERELVEFGFRRGVGYNLLALNPEGEDPLNFVINPLDFPGAPEKLGNKDPAVVGKFVCDGSMTAPRLRGGSEVYVQSPFPSELRRELNSRFDEYIESDCLDKVAVPDKNIRQFHTLYSKWWMSTIPSAEFTSSQSVKVSTDDGGKKLVSVSDGFDKVAAHHYGTLWAFARPVRHDPSAPGEAGTPFDDDSWPVLYPATGNDLNATMGTVAPYFDVGAHLVAAPYPRMQGRRILYVPLLQCSPVPPTDRATVLGVGRFLMTAKASASAIHAEFGGLAPDAELGTSVGLHR